MRAMSIPLRQRLFSAFNCTPPDTLIRPRFSLQILTTLAAVLGRRQPHNVPPLHTAQAVHEVVAEEYRILESVNYEVVTYTLAGWVCLFEARFSLRVQHLRQRTPQVTGSLVSPHWELCLVPFVRGLGQHPAFWARPRALPTLLSLALFRTFEAGSFFFFVSFSHLS